MPDARPGKRLRIETGRRRPKIHTYRPANALPSLLKNTCLHGANVHAVPVVVRPGGFILIAPVAKVGAVEAGVGGDGRRLFWNAGKVCAPLLRNNRKCDRDSHTMSNRDDWPG